MVHEQGNVVYVGAAPNAPQIGDVRITFTYVQPAKQISVLAQVNGNTFRPFKTKNGKTVSALSMGVKSMDEMYEAKHTSNSMLTWVLRFAGAALVIAGLKVLFAPLQPQAGELQGFLLHVEDDLMIFFSMCLRISRPERIMTPPSARPAVGRGKRFPFRFS